MILVTGASGQLGRLVIEQLLEIVPANTLVAGVRDPQKATDLADKGVHVRHFDYGNTASMTAALMGVTKILLISSSEIGQRVSQHQAVIEAAKTADIELFAYTSILHADTSSLALAAEHKHTEALLRESGLPYVLLRNGWYSENYTMSVGAAVEYKVVLGCADTGRLSTASRHDYALAAAKVLTQPNQAGNVYELAGDTAFTLAEYAAYISEIVKDTIHYQPMTQADYAAQLRQVGLPAEFAELLADSEAAAARGDLFDDSHQLSTLIGRATTDIKTSLNAALKVN